MFEEMLQIFSFSIGKSKMPALLPIPEIFFLNSGLVISNKGSPVINRGKDYLFSVPLHRNNDGVGRGGKLRRIC